MEFRITIHLKLKLFDYMLIIFKEGLRCYLKMNSVVNVEWDGLIF